MSLFVKLILWVSVLWILPVIVVLLRNETAFKKNIVVGVTFPHKAREDADIQAVLMRFKRELLYVSIILILLAAAAFFVRPFNLHFALWSFWLILLIVLPYVPYVRCNLALHELKRSKGYVRKNLMMVDTAATGAAGAPLPLWYFAVAALISLLPLLWEREWWIIYLMYAIFAFLCYPMYRFLYRRKAEAIDGDTRLTMVLTQVRMRNWGVIWLMLAFTFALLSPIHSFSASWPIAVIIFILCLSVIIAVAALRMEYTTRRVQEKLTAESGTGEYVDEDRHWIWGIFYYNHDDKRLIINNRVGLNTTLNLARPSGKIWMGLTVLLLILMPFTWYWIDAAASRPLILQVEGEELVAGQGKGQYRIPLDQVEETELLEKLPDKLARVMGTGLENLLKGDFSAPGLSALKVSLDPTSPPFLLLRTKKGRTYLLGLRERLQTEAVYDLLQTVNKR